MCSGALAPAVLARPPARPACARARRDPFRSPARGRPRARPRSAGRLASSGARAGARTGAVSPGTVPGCGTVPGGPPPRRAASAPPPASTPPALAPLRGSGRLSGAGRDPREHGADLHGRLDLDQDLAHDPGDRGRHLGVDLVGGDLADRLARPRSCRRPATRQATTVPSATETPICGIVTSTSRPSRCSVRKQLTACIADALDAGQHRLLERRRERDRDVRRGHAHDRSVEVLEAALRRSAPPPPRRRRRSSSPRR